MDDILNILSSKFVINIVLGIIGVVLIVILFKKRIQNLSGSKSDDSKLEEKKAAYFATKNQSKEEKLTMQGKLELSWKFLYEIAEMILNKFSPEDKLAILQLGKDLAKAGMKYEHIIDLGIKKKERKVAPLQFNKDKSEKVRGV